MAQKTCFEPPLALVFAPMSGRQKIASLATLAVALAALGDSAGLAEPPPGVPPPGAGAGALPPPSLAPLPAADGLPPERRAILIVDGKERIVDAVAAQKAGYTLVDLSDTWTPYIFVDGRAEDGSVLGNRYRTIFLGLANDTGDDDGQPIPAGAHNYLEVFGIQPSLSVLRERFLGDDPDPCAQLGVNYETLRAVKSVPAYQEGKEKKELARVAAIIARVEARQKAAAKKGAKPDPRLADDVADAEKLKAQRGAFAEAEKRLVCEKLFPKKYPKHTAGRLDEAMQQAIVRFQHKNKLYEGAALRPDTMKALARTPLENDYEALVRTLTERAVSAANVVEDGTAIDGKGKGPPMYTNEKGEKRPVRDMVSEVTRATIEQLGLGTPEAALAFFRAHDKASLQWLRAAIRMPPMPEYYSGAMELSVEIDRGDVIYDPPFDENGKPTPFSRRKFPSLTLNLKWRDQLIPLIRWRTTIGGWRSDQAPNGYEYFRYKGSDVGPRIWRNIVSAPVWIAPNSTPLRSLVKWKTVNGSSQQVVNYDELGPGYLSAYGLVVAYNVEPGVNGKPDGDNGVRVHGSSEYRSIRNPEGYSHGCHRLMNHLAERMFSYVLQHRTVRVEGERRLGHARQFLWKNDVYELRLPARGFWYTLDPPLQVNVLEGNIVGRVKKPITRYMPKPGVAYPPGPPPSPSDSPEGRAGGGD